MRTRTNETKALQKQEGKMNSRAKDYRIFGNIVLAIVTVVMLAACGPSISTQTRLTWSPYDASEFKQTKDNLTVENREVKELPPQLITTLQACNEAGVPSIDQQGQPIMEKVAIADPSQMWYQVSITNSTGHVINLNKAVIRLFDPAGNPNEPVSKDDLAASFLVNRPCPSSQQAVNNVKLLKMIDRNVEIVPDATVTGWLVFQPPSTQIPGTWKLALYELPVGVDEAGNVTKTTKFEIRTILKKFIDTYKQDSLFDEKKLIESKEAAE